MASNPMMEMALKALGIDNAILKQAADIGETFRRLLESQALLHVKTDRHTEMLMSVQVALQIIPPPDVSEDMADLIAVESRKFLGRTIMGDVEVAGHAGGFPGPGIVADAYVKLENLLKIREGIKLETYLDSKGQLTVGIGHLVHPVNDDDPLNDGLPDAGIRITQEQCDAFFRTDAQGAMDAAIRQMAEAGITSADFLPWLASVNFQLGPNWTQEFTTTWNMLVSGRYAETAEHIVHTDWAHQTPVRVADFQRALRALPAKGAA